MPTSALLVRAALEPSAAEIVPQVRTIVQHVTTTTQCCRSPEYPLAMFSFVHTWDRRNDINIVWVTLNLLQRSRTWGWCMVYCPIAVPGVEERDTG